ncbi:uncharacterized protein C3orf20 homolog isoform X1 [Monodelphis domestica]|uniref:uncharacterized protein C3orf20 homolog isoform X1 n=2 Tax=Monodelphis domestica TaxID=13616 RepID=UPI0024E198C8|nr:uncharacterized protein C3orf20 homolog isoform X1 [Monodelphis domestica]
MRSHKSLMPARSFLDRNKKDIAGEGKNMSKDRKKKNRDKLPRKGIVTTSSPEIPAPKEDVLPANISNMSNFAKSNTELYHRYKELAPKLLDEISKLLITCRSLGIVMPRGIKNIFEFTWEELIMEPPSPTSSKIAGLDVLFGSTSPNMDLSLSPGLSRKPMAKNSPYPSPSYIQPISNSQQTLHKFQKKSIYLLSELLALKLKMMIESSSVSSHMDLSRHLTESNQLLRFKAKEMILESMLDTVGLGKGGGGNPLQVYTAIGVNCPYQLTYQSSNACLSFSLSGAKEKRETPSKNKIITAEESNGKILGSSAPSELFIPNDPCIQAREKLQAMCRMIEAERNSWKGRRYSFPIVLHNYIDKRSNFHPSSPFKKDSKTALNATERAPYPIGHHSQSLETKWKRAFRFHYSFYDGTTFVFYPSGHVAVSQIPTCCKGRYTTCIFNDTSNFPIIGLFTAEGHGSVNYNLKNRCPCMFMMNHEGGSIKDSSGHTVHKWNWTSKKRTLLSLEYKMNEQIKLRVFGQDCITLTFSDLNESVSLVISPTDCPHGVPREKRYSFRSSTEERTSKMIRALVEIKKRFQKTVTQFMNSVLLLAGLLTIDYPLKDEIELGRFRKKSPSHIQWIQKSASESLSHTHSTVHTSSADSFRDDSSSGILSTLQRKSIRSLSRGPVRSKSATMAELRPSNAWAIALADCPLMLRKFLLKEDTSLGCRCLVKIPIVSDLEFEQFISAPRSPDQILVVGVMTSQNPTKASHLEWTLDRLYLHNQYGRPSPCIQCRHDPYRLLRYDINGILRKDPPLLVQKYAVMPGMILMFSGGKLLFGGSVFNGYGSCSKKNLLKQIFWAHQHSKMGYFLPENFKFSTLSPFFQSSEGHKNQEEKQQQETVKEIITEERSFATEEIIEEDFRKKFVTSPSPISGKPMLLETLIESGPPTLLELKIRKKSISSRKREKKSRK